MRPIDIGPADLETIRHILRDHVPGLEVHAFGSRVSWTARETSDLDLALMTDGALSIARMAALRAAFTESDLPFRVDLVDWANTSEGFRNVIETAHVVLVKREWQRPEARGWRETTLGSVTEFLSGGTPSKAQAAYWNGSMPWVSAKDMKRFRLRDTENHVTVEGVANGTKLVPAGTVLLLVRGMTLLNDLPVCVTERPMTFNQDVKALRPKPEIDPDFLPYLMLCNKLRLLDLVDLAGHGTGRLNSEELKALEIRLPPLPDQRAIAHILGTLDDKIDLNRRMNATLEAMARALFTSWFVDFDPVRAKMEGRDTGLPKDIADLFPDRLVESELGEIPEGWGVGHVEDGFEIIMGQSPPGHTYNDTGDGLPFFQGRSDFGFRYPKNRKYCTAPNRLAQPWDTIVSVRAPVGDINMAWERCCIGRGVAALRPRSGAVSFGYCTAQALQTHMREYEHTGTVFGAINRKQLARLPLQQPAADIVRAFERLVHPWDQTIRLRTAEVDTLTALRDALLPKLVSGELRMNGLESASGRDVRPALVGTQKA